MNTVSYQLIVTSSDNKKAETLVCFGFFNDWLL